MHSLPAPVSLALMESNLYNEAERKSKLIESAEHEHVPTVQSCFGEQC